MLRKPIVCRGYEPDLEPTIPNGKSKPQKLEKQFKDADATLHETFESRNQRRLINLTGKEKAVCALAVIEIYHGRDRTAECAQLSFREKIITQSSVNLPYAICGRWPERLSVICDIVWVLVCTCGCGSSRARDQSPGEKTSSYSKLSPIASQHSRRLQLARASSPVGSKFCTNPLYPG
jgi:hypothetical protein